MAILGTIGVICAVWLRLVSLNEYAKRHKEFITNR
nr:MAG TPA: hypothetical protein [Caudoviricetes sp.]